MSKFIIPKGKTYTFQVKIYEEDSFLPQDMTNGTATFGLVKLDDAATPLGTEFTATIIDALNGVVEFILPDTFTTTLDWERGPKVDGYYLKPTYQGIINVTFTDDNMDRVALVNKVYVSPTGV